MAEQRHFRVWLRTRSGMYAQYSGHVDVWAEDEDDAGQRAITELKRTTFPDYGREMWRVVNVQEFSGEKASQHASEKQFMVDETARKLVDALLTGS